MQFFQSFRFTKLLPIFAISSLALALAMPSSAQEIVSSHAFSGEELTAHPSENWITNGGNTLNQRFSPLTQINRFNVADLKAKWTSKMGTGAEFKNGGPALTTNGLSLSEVMLVVSDGRNTMPAFATFTQQELTDIGTFVADQLGDR